MTFSELGNWGTHWSPWLPLGDFPPGVLVPVSTTSPSPSAPAANAPRRCSQAPKPPPARNGRDDPAAVEAPVQLPPTPAGRSRIAPACLPAYGTTMAWVSSNMTTTKNIPTEFPLLSCCCCCCSMFLRLLHSPPASFFITTLYPPR